MKEKNIVSEITKVGYNALNAPVRAGWNAGKLAVKAAGALAERSITSGEELTRKMQRERPLDEVKQGEGALEYAQELQQGLEQDLENGKLKPTDSEARRQTAGIKSLLRFGHTRLARALYIARTEMTTPAEEVKEIVVVVLENETNPYQVLPNDEAEVVDLTIGEFYEPTDQDPTP